MKRLLALILFFALALPAQAMTTPLLVANSPSAGYSASAVRYFGIMGFGDATLASTDAYQVPVPAAGTFSKLYVRFPTALAAGTSYTVALMLNGSPTSLSAQVTDAGLVASDTSNTVAVVVGDLVSFRITPSGTPASQTRMQVGVVFDATTSGESPIFSIGTTASTTGTVYAPVGIRRAFGTPENVRSTVVPTAGVLDNLYVQLATAPGVGKSHVLTMMVNGVATSQACTISDNATTCNNTTDVTLAAGDTISIRQVPSGTPAATAIKFSNNFIPTTNGESVMLALSDVTSATVNNFVFTSGIVANEATESDAYSIAPIAFTWKKLYLDYNTAPGAGNSRAFYGRINAATTTLTADVTGTNTTANDTTNSDAVAAGDLMNWVTTPVSTPDAPVLMRVSAVMYIAPPASSVDNGIIGLVWSLIF